MEEQPGEDEVVREVDVGEDEEMVGSLCRIDSREEQIGSRPESPERHCETTIRYCTAFLHTLYVDDEKFVQSRTRIRSVFLLRLCFILQR